MEPDTLAIMAFHGSLVLPGFAAEVDYVLGDRKISVPMNRDHHERISASFPKVVVAAPDVCLLEAGPLQRAEKPLAPDPGETTQGVATSRSTTSVSVSARGIGMPSFTAASR